MGKINTVINGEFVETSSANFRPLFSEDTSNVLHVAEGGAVTVVDKSEAQRRANTESGQWLENSVQYNKARQSIFTTTP